MIPPDIISQKTDTLIKKIQKNPKKSFYWYDLNAIQQGALLINTRHNKIFQARFAMKANSNPTIVKTLYKSDIRIDACSEYEAHHAMKFGVSPLHIQVSSQQSPSDRTSLYSKGISCVATSLNQLQDFCTSVPGGIVGVRINPGKGSGQFQKINTGGIQSSFGIWHQYIDHTKQIIEKSNVKIHKLHIHIGSGSDLETRIDTFRYCLKMIEQFPDLSILNMGGGYKIGRMPNETHTNLPKILDQILPELNEYNINNHRNIQLEIEPGSYFVAQHGYIICLVDDIVDTGSNGYTFVKTTTGMDMFLRPALYHAQHPIYHYSLKQKKRSGTGKREYCFVGHCCESSDIITPNSEGGIGLRGFDTQIERGDLLVIGGCGAYCESMKCSGYNGF